MIELSWAHSCVCITNGCLAKDGLAYTAGSFSAVGRGWVDVPVIFKKAGLGLFLWERMDFKREREKQRDWKPARSLEA